jgi:uncharacterized membrane protein YczE
MPRRIGQLLVGLFLYGIGIPFIVRGAIGAASWDELTQGIARHVPSTFWTITVLVSLLVLLLSVPLRQRPGTGAVLNALLVGPLRRFSLQLFHARLDRPTAGDGSTPAASGAIRMHREATR